jgi:limonene-1,2-epoxide hydrolase
MSTGMVDGSEVRTVVSNDDTVVIERVDVNIVFGKKVTFHVTAVFDVRDGSITSWREYWDTADAAQQLGIDPAQMFQHLGG